MDKTNNIKIFFLLCLTIFCIGINCIINIPDNDLWARLIAGAHIVENFSVLKNDFLSYTPTHPWYDHEWGASIFFYGALKYFGGAGLIFLKGIMIAITMFVCYKTIELRKPTSTVPYNILYYILMFFAVNMSLGHTVRCLLFTSLFFSIFLYLLERAKLGENKFLFFLPLIMLFWSNIHGGCLSGIGLLVIYIVGEFLNKKPIKKYILTLIACLGVLFINPYGFEYVKFLFHAGLMDRSFISEWHSAFDKEFITKHLEYKAYLLIMLLTQVIYFIKTKAKYENIDKTKLLIILAMTYLSVKHIRHQAFFAFTVGTLLYDEFYYLINSAIKYLKEKLNLIDEKQFDIIVKAKEILIYTIILAVSLPALLNDKKEIKITESEYPRYAIEFIELNKITGNLLLNFDWGSYAAYKLYPNNLIVMDGRYEEVYDPKLLVDLRNFHLLEGDWYKIVRDYKTDVMILEKKYPVYEKILENKEWTLIFENNLSGVFVPTNTVKEEYKYPIPVDDYYNKTLFHTKIKF